jgi:hypothetical protein
MTNTKMTLNHNQRRFFPVAWPEACGAPKRVAASEVQSAFLEFIFTSSLPGHVSIER